MMFCLVSPAAYPTAEANRGSSLSARLPHTCGCADWAAVPHEARCKLLGAGVRGLRPVPLGGCECLGGIVGEGPHNVTCVARAIISPVKVWGMDLAFCTGAGHGWLGVSGALGVPCAKA